MEQQRGSLRAESDGKVLFTDGQYLEINEHIAACAKDGARIIAVAS